MMRRALSTLSICLAAGCGRLDVETRPAAPSAEAAPTATPATSATPAAQAPLPPPPKFLPPSDKALSFDLKIARDSAADEAVLDNLADAAPRESLPDMPIDVESNRELNIEAYADQPRVQYYVDFFASRIHDRFQIWLTRMPRFEAYARERLAAQGLPSDLVYLALIESGFSTSAVSRAAAVGMWQFMPATGRGYGLRIDSWVDDRRDPVKATDAAARHLKDLTDRFGSHYLAAAAYNAGAGRVGRSLTRMNASASESDGPMDLSSDEAFFSLADTRLIVQETRDYVPKLIAAALIAKDPVKFGFVTPDDVEPFPHDSVMVEGGTGLDLIARLADTTLDALRELNPHLLRLVTPPGGYYAVRVPDGEAKQIAAAYHDTPESERLAIATHKVRSGETVTALAKKYGVTSDVIKSANRSARGRRLTVGSTLYIPMSTSIPLALFREPEPVGNGGSRTHLVKRGETLGGIAQRYHVSIASLRSANRMGRSNLVRIGQRLVIRGGSASRATAKRTTTSGKTSTTRLASKAPAARSHVVRSGETLSGIASRYGVGLSALAAANGISRNAHVKTGQKLRIPKA
ncbi:MAG: LysM peptidoglycan-binding domain-containing protein [Gemmatimonadota bacterium]